MRRTAPLKSATGELINDRQQQMKHWAEHYSELYSKETVVTEAALNTIDDMPIIKELDQVPKLQELSKAIDMLQRSRQGITLSLTESQVFA